MKRFLVSLILAVSLAAVGVALPQSANAAWNPFSNRNPESVCQQEGTGGSAVCQAGTNDPIAGQQGVLIRVTRIVATIGGIIAIIIMIVGGYMYITSNGEANKISTAKNTIIYAAVGLVVIALAQTLIVFIINRIAPSNV